MANVPHMEEEEVNNDKFIGNYCETCDKCGETRCWCNSSEWGEELVNVENPNANTTLENKTPPLMLENPQQDGLSIGGRPLKLHKKTIEK